MRLPLIAKPTSQLPAHLKSVTVACSNWAWQFGQSTRKVAWVMADLWVKMMYFKVRFAVSFFESEGTNLTPPIMQFSEQNTKSRGYTLVALGRTRKYSWTWLAR